MVDNADNIGDYANLHGVERIERNDVSVDRLWVNKYWICGSCTSWRFMARVCVIRGRIEAVTKCCDFKHVNSPTYGMPDIELAQHKATSTRSIPRTEQG